MNDLGPDNCLLLSCVIAQLEILMENVLSLELLHETKECDLSKFGPIPLTSFIKMAKLQLYQHM